MNSFSRENWFCWIVKRFSLWTESTCQWCHSRLWQWEIVSQAEFLLIYWFDMDVDSSFLICNLIVLYHAIKLIYIYRHSLLKYSFCKNLGLIQIFIIYRWLVWICCINSLIEVLLFLIRVIFYNIISSYNTSIRSRCLFFFNCFFFSRYKLTCRSSLL